jgi:protein-disulfide isomerase/type II secretory pathway component PulC
MRFLLLPLVLLAACSRSPDTVQTTAALPPPAVAESADAIVARVGDRSITAAEVDGPIALALHDLDMQKYRLRRQAVEGEVLRQLEDAPGPQRLAEIRLEPPTPPRLPVQADPDRVRPSGDAPVTVLAFCNFESPHCARLQRTLSQVLPLFPGVVRYGERDLPLEFHRHAGQAAEAARCAAEQGNYWRFHDMLYAGSGAPDRERLERTARASDLDMTAFAACLDGRKRSEAVAADVAVAQSLGLATVPAVFVNGLYASPDVKPSDLVWLIEGELETLGRASPRQVAAQSPSDAPFRLWGVISSSTPGQGLALLSPSSSPDRVGMYREGDAVATGLVLRRLTAEGIELQSDQGTARMGFDTRSPPMPPQAEDEVSALIAANPHRAVPVTLDRERVLVLMSDRIALAAALQTVPMTSGGYRQLKLKEVAPGSLYELLGFQAGDVILGVNEQPVTEAFNPLWDALEKEGEVRVRVMRRGGLAQHFTYRFEE